MRKPFVLHHCRHADEDDGAEFRCDCQGRVTKLQADDLRASGSFVLKKIRKADGTFAYDSRQLVPCGELPKPRTVKTISAEDIERAFVNGERYAQVRIEVFAERQGEKST